MRAFSDFKNANAMTLALFQAFAAEKSGSHEWESLLNQIEWCAWRLNCEFLDHCITQSGGFDPVPHMQNIQRVCYRIVYRGLFVPMAKG
jgi:hypothetical protein